MKGFKLILKNNNFLYIWFSQILSQLTINIMNFVLLVKLFENTGSSIATSLLWIAYSLPAIFLGPIASASVDLMDRRRILVFTNFFQALTIFVYALSHKFSIFLVYGVVLIYSLLNQFYVPAESATLPSVVKKGHLSFGNGLFFITQQSAIIAGFGLAGLLNHLLPFSTVLFLCSFLVFLAFLSTLMLPSLKIREKSKFTIESSIGGFFEKIAEGYKFIRQNNSVLAPFLLLIGIQVVVQVIIISVPSIAKDIIEIPINSASLFIVIPAAIGAITGAIAVPRLLSKGWRKKRVIIASLETIALALFLITFLLGFITSPFKAYLSFFLVALGGMAFVGVTVPSNTYLQEVTPANLRGRVFGNFWFLVTVASVFPVIFSGTVIELLGVRFLMFTLTAVSVATLIFSKKFDLIGNGK
jgi:MFS family permease